MPSSSGGKRSESGRRPEMRVELPRMRWRDILWRSWLTTSLSSDWSKSGSVWIPHRLYDYWGTCGAKKGNFKLASPSKRSSFESINVQMWNEAIDSPLAPAFLQVEKLDLFGFVNSDFRPAPILPPPRVRFPETWAEDFHRNVLPPLLRT